VRIGHISKIQRRPVLGQWQTCLYKLGDFIFDKVKAVIIGFIKIINRVASTRHIVPIKPIIKILEENKRSKTPGIHAPPNLDYLVDMARRHPELV